MAENELPQITIDGSFVPKINEANEATKKLNTSVKDLNTSTKVATESGDKFAGSQENVAEAIKETSEAADGSATSLDMLSVAANNTSSIITELKNSYDKLMVGLQETNVLSGAQNTAFGLLNVGLFGVKEKFNSFENISTKGLSLFKDESKLLVDSLKNDFLNGNLDSITSKIVGMFGDGEFAKGATAAAKEGQTQLQKYFDSFSNGVDNVQKLSNAMIQLSASTGDLGNLYNLAGHDLGNLNAVIDQQSSHLSQLGQLYNLQPDILATYYSQMGKIPGALRQNISATDEAHQSISMLGAAIQLAKGTGRDFTDIVSDMHTSIKEFGTTNDQALTFTSRISEITNKYGLELTDVRSKLIEIGSSFKFFGNEAEGAARLVNTYAGSIRDTGVSGKTALEIVGNMTNGIREMSLEQKAFLSAQTGGAGGLQGAFQIEKLFREDKLDEVFDKVKTAMKKQFGEIASLEEAAADQSAAARLTKQISILRSGPLGKFANDDQSAIRILESFKKDETPELRADKLGDAEEVRNSILDRGNLLLEEYNTALSKINRTIDVQRQLSDRPAAEIVRGVLKTPSDNVALQKDIGQNVYDYNSGMTEEGKDNFVDKRTDRVKSSVNRVKDIGANITNVYENITGSLKDPKNINDNNFNKQLEAARLSSINEMNVKGNLQETQSKNVIENQTNINQQNNIQKTLDGQETKLTLAVPKIDFSIPKIDIQIPKLEFSPDTLKGVINKNVQEETKLIKEPVVQPVTQNNSDLGKVMVDVSVRCVDCHSKLDHSQHSYAMGATRTNQK